MKKELVLGMINWTNTFKRDSEIFSPYGQLQRLPEGMIVLDEIINIDEWRKTF